MSNVVVKLSAIDIETALKNYAISLMSGTKLTPESVTIKSEGRSGEYTDEVDFVPSKQPMKRQKPRDMGDAGKKYKDDKRKRREAVERKRGG
jgi:hypothetical protein